MLAWICLQLHCDRIFPKGGRANGVQATAKADATAVKPSKEAIYSSKPDIVLCNWSVSRGGAETRTRDVLVPLGFPPTFKVGRAASILIAGFRVPSSSTTGTCKWPCSASTSPFKRSSYRCGF